MYAYVVVVCGSRSGGVKVREKVVFVISTYYTTVVVTVVIAVVYIVVEFYVENVGVYIARAFHHVEVTNVEARTTAVGVFAYRT